MCDMISTKRMLLVWGTAVGPTRVVEFFEIRAYETYTCTHVRRVSRAGIKCRSIRGLGAHLLRSFDSARDTFALINEDAAVAAYRLAASAEHVADAVCGFLVRAHNKRTC